MELAGASCGRPAAHPRRLRSRARCRSPTDSSHQPALALLALDALEQRAEVTRAEAAIALALDDLVEERAGGAVVIQARRLLEEDLQHVRVVMIAVDQLLELA